MSLIFLLFSMSYVYADTFEGHNDNTSLFLKIDNDIVTGNMRIDGITTSFESTIKFRTNGDFRIQLFENKMLLGFPSDDEIKIIILERPIKQNQRITLMIQKLDTSTYEKVIEKELTIMEKFEAAQIKTGLGNIAEENILEAERLKEEAQKLAEQVNKISRTHYQLIDDELELVVRADNHVLIKTTFDFDLRAIDQNENKYSQFYGGGYLDDVIITGSIIDPDGKVWDTINATTDENGYYESEGMYIPDNTSTRGEWSLELDGIKYFDDLEQYSTFSIVKSFFIIENSNSSKSSEEEDPNIVDFDEGS